MSRLLRPLVAFLVTCLQLQSSSAIQLDLNDTASIKSAASTIAYNMMTYYTGNLTGQVPGLLPRPYYWWETGAMFGSLIDYWYYTGDTSYNSVTMQALQFQVGAYNNYEPVNRTAELGNDDQVFWGIAAMSAAELGFPNPPPSQPQWLALAQAVFTRQAGRWEYSTCGGGLRWQIPSVNPGYDYKNTVSNGGFFALAARLGAYTGNQTYFDWANKAYDWMAEIGLVGSAYQAFDGTDVKNNCSDVNHVMWSYNGGVMLIGSAVMWNQTTGDEQKKWQTRVQGFINNNKYYFFQNGTTMWEFQCEENYSGAAICNTDQLSFKAYLSRWMAATTKVASWTADQIQPLLRSSAYAAAQQCTGGSSGAACGSRWWRDYDGTAGVGQQMSALEVIQSNLITIVKGPVSSSTGGTSQGDVTAGTTGADIRVSAPALGAVSQADRAGAGVLTAIALITFLSGTYWMCV